MNRVLVVSKTRMWGGRVCVGGHDLDEGMQSLRLLRFPGTNMPADTKFEIGQVWKLSYEPIPHIRPPHVEDVHVDPRGARLVDTIEPLGPFLRKRVTVWKRAPFEGALLRTDSGTGYVPAEGPFPSCSTGYWSGSSFWSSTARVGICFAPTGGGDGFATSALPSPRSGSSRER